MPIHRERKHCYGVGNHKFPPKVALLFSVEIFFFLRTRKALLHRVLASCLSNEIPDACSFSFLWCFKDLLLLLVFGILWGCVWLWHFVLFSSSPHSLFFIFGLVPFIFEKLFYNVVYSRLVAKSRFKSTFHWHWNLARFTSLLTPHNPLSFQLEPRPWHCPSKIWIQYMWGCWLIYANKAKGRSILLFTLSSSVWTRPVPPILICVPGGATNQERARKTN